ncbi:hypothetical protein SCA6_004684 [Theobroma cacao]
MDKTQRSHLDNPSTDTHARFIRRPNCIQSLGLKGSTQNKSCSHAIQNGGALTHSAEYTHFQPLPVLPSGFPRCRSGPSRWRCHQQHGKF